MTTSSMTHLAKEKNMTTATATQYIVVPAPGHYGDIDRVYSAHRTLEAARRACRSGSVVRRNASLAKGDKWLRVYEQTSPEV
jgi:hypothetical protein